MAVTITGNPNTHTPAYNECMFVATSTNVAQTNFRFRCEILDSSLTTIAIVDVFPDANNYMLFDAHRVLENYVTSNPTLTDMTELSMCANSIYEYALKITERYGSPLSNGATTTSGGGWCFNAAMKWRDFIDYDEDNYFIKSGSVVQFLTNSPSNQYVYTNEKSFLHFGVKATGVANKARIRTYSSGGVLLQTVLIKNNYSTLLLIAGRHIIRMPSGWNLNSISGAEITSGSQPIITTSVAYWIIDIVDDTAGVISLTEEKIFTSATECTIYDSYRIHFLNSLGGFDSFTFNRRSTSGTKIERKTFEPVYGGITGGIWSYSQTEQRKKDFYIEDEETIKLNSDWITQEQSTWLYELVTSPEIYVEQGGSIYSAHIKTSEYMKRNHASDKIFNLEMEIELGKNIRQRW